MMFKCRAQKHIYRHFDPEGKNEFGCDAVYEFSLPFAPYVGLRIVSEGASFRINSVVFDIEKQVFICYCPPDFLKPMDGCGYEGLKEIAVDEGWRLSELKAGIYEELKC